MTKDYETVISCEGCRYHLIYGKHCYGYYLVIPEWYIGCEMSDYKDTFWNAESLRKTGLTETLNLQFGDFLPQSTRSCTVNMLLIG